LIGANIPKRCCHVFAKNKSIDPKQVIGAQSLPRVEMPNPNLYRSLPEEDTALIA
jgi:hypothetical protein